MWNCKYPELQELRQNTICRNYAIITFSGRLLASAIFVIGRADVLDANTQCSGMCYRKTKLI